MAKGDCNTAKDPMGEILTPNRLKLGRNNLRAMHINTKIDEPLIPSDLLRHNRKIMKTFYGLMMDRVHHLVLKPNKWNHNDDRPPR